MYWDHSTPPLPKLGSSCVAPDIIVCAFRMDEGNDMRGEYCPLSFVIKHDMQERGASIDTAVTEPTFGCS